MNSEKSRIVVGVIKDDLSRHDQSNWTNIDAEPGYEYGTEEVYPDQGTPKVKESEGQVINCGTTACLAGHAGFIFAPVGTKFYRDNMRIPGRPLIPYDVFAQEELELSGSEVSYLFSGIRDIGEIEEYI